MTNVEVAALVLAGGRGARLGLGVPKALVTIAGRTLLDRAIAVARALGEAFVALPAGLELGAIGVPVVRDVPGVSGPLAGVVAGLEARPASRVAVLAIDYPLMTAAWLMRALDRLAAGTFDAVIARPGGVPQPLAAAYAPDATLAFRAALESGDRSIHAGLDRLRIDWVDDAELAAWPGGALALLNVNTPEDLARAETLLGQADAARPVAPEAR